MPERLNKVALLWKSPYVCLNSSRAYEFKNSFIEMGTGEK
jgi:hypothetical protein